MRIRITAVVAVVMGLSGLWTVPVRADDWPTYQHDNRRSGVTTEQLRLPLRKLWEYVSSERPQPAWSRPANFCNCVPCRGEKRRLGYV